MDKTYAGPELHVGADGKYTVDAAFVRGLIAWFKDGKPLPRRYVWEIVLGAHGHFAWRTDLKVLAALLGRREKCMDSISDSTLVVVLVD